MILQPLLGLLFVFGAILPLLHAEEPADAEGITFFETHIRPALVKYCYECHSTKEKIRGGLVRQSGRTSCWWGFWTCDRAG